MVFTPCHFFTFFNIYYSYSSCFFSNCQATSPFHTWYISFNQFFCIISFRRPDIDSIVKDNTNHIIFAPIKQSCVEIVFESWGIEYFVWCFGKLPIYSGLLDLSLSQTIIKIHIAPSDYFRFVWRLKITLQRRREYRLVVFLFLPFLANSLNGIIVLIASIWVNIEV